MAATEKPVRVRIETWVIGQFEVWGNEDYADLTVANGFGETANEYQISFTYDFIIGTEYRMTLLDASDRNRGQQQQVYEGQVTIDLGRINP